MQSKDPEPMLPMKRPRLGTPHALKQRPRKNKSPSPRKNKSPSPRKSKSPSPKRVKGDEEMDDMGYGEEVDYEFDEADEEEYKGSPKKGSGGVSITRSSLRGANHAQQVAQ